MACLDSAVMVSRLLKHNLVIPWVLQLRRTAVYSLLIHPINVSAELDWTVSLPRLLGVEV